MVDHDFHSFAAGIVDTQWSFQESRMVRLLHRQLVRARGSFSFIFGSEPFEGLA